MNVKRELHKFRTQVKEEICRLLKEKYLEIYDIEPNWEEEDEYILHTCEMNIDKMFLLIEVGNTYDENTYFERQEIQECRVTLDDNLFFICGEDVYNEIDWEEISTDELVDIYFHLK